MDETEALDADALEMATGLQQELRSLQVDRSFYAVRSHEIMIDLPDVGAVVRQYIQPSDPAYGRVIEAILAAYDNWIETRVSDLGVLGLKPETIDARIAVAEEVEFSALAGEHLAVMSVTQAPVELAALVELGEAWIGWVGEADNGELPVPPAMKTWRQVKLPQSQIILLFGPAA